MNGEIVSIFFKIKLRNFYLCKMNKKLNSEIYKTLQFKLDKIMKQEIIILQKFIKEK